MGSFRIDLAIDLTAIIATKALNVLDIV